MAATLPGALHLPIGTTRTRSPVAMQDVGARESDGLEWLREPEARRPNGSAPWLLRVLAWDGLLPVVVASSPVLIGALAPGWRGGIEINAVLLPVVAFLFRIRAGRRHIGSNHCSGRLRGGQYVAFGLGIVLLVFIEAVLTLAHIMPAGALLATREDTLIWGLIGSAYLGTMAFAMYPGRPPM